MKTINCDFCGKEIKRKTFMPPEPKAIIQFERVSFSYDCCWPCGVKILRSLGKDEDAECVRAMERRI